MKKCDKILEHAPKGLQKREKKEPAVSTILGNQDNVKVFVLYLMQNVGYPMDFVTINDVRMQTDYIAYLDFAETFSVLEDIGLIAKVGTNERGEPTYAVTDRGATVVESMRNRILPSILDESLTCALRFLDFSRRGVKASCKIAESPGGGYDVTCTLTEKGKTLLSLTLYMDTKAKADLMEAQFRRAPENVYRASLALMSGNVNYLFN